MAKKALVLRERPCTIGGSINTRTQLHGEEKIPACDIPIEGVMLTQPELDKLLGAGTHARWYVKGKGGAIEPAFPDVHELKLSVKFKECAVTMTLHGKTHTFADCKLGKLVAQRQVGGMTWLGMQLQTTDEIDVRAAVNADIRAQIAFGSRVMPNDAQQELALNEGEADDEADDADKPKAKAKKAKGNGKEQPAAN